MKQGTGKVVANKQMPNFLSCLTKLLFLWPGFSITQNKEAEEDEDDEDEEETSPKRLGRLDSS